MDEKNYFTDKNIMYLTNSLVFGKPKKIENRDFYLLKITDVCYEEQAPKKEALENVLSSLKMDGIYFRQHRIITTYKQNHPAKC